MPTRPRSATFACLFLAVLALAACGNKGALLLPPPSLDAVEDGTPPATELPPATEPSEADPPAEIEPPPAADPPSDPGTEPVGGDTDGDG